MNKYSDLTRPKTVKSNKLLHQCTQIGMRTGHPRITSLKHRDLAERTVQGLSNFTTRQNMILSSLGSSVSSSYLPKRGLSTQRVEMRTERDFLKLMNQLDAVILNKRSSRAVLLLEGAPHEQFTEEGSVQYFKVEVLGKRCPLKVEIYRYGGNLRVFYSKNDAEPSESSHDGAVKQDTFMISDASLKFKTEFIGIAVLAMSDSKYSITIKFESKSFGILPVEDEIRTSSRMSTSKTPRATYSKNFLKLNKTPVPLNSPRGEHMVNFKDWKERREMVVVRKKEHLHLKKQRTIMHINRNAIMKEEAERVRVEAEETRVMEERQKHWLKLISFAQVFKRICEVVDSAKDHKISSFKRQGSVRKIQKLYRSATKSLFPDTLNLITCRENLLLFSSSFKAASGFQSQIARFVRQSAENNKPKAMFVKLKKKLEFVQKIWKVYKKNDKERWENLNKMWNKVFEKIELNRSNSSKKKRTSQKIQIINKEAKNQVLAEYFIKRKKEYLANVKIYFATHAYNTQAFPGFNYLPSETEMHELINRVSIYY